MLGRAVLLSKRSNPSLARAYCNGGCMSTQVPSAGREGRGLAIFLFALRALVYHGVADGPWVGVKAGGSREVGAEAGRRGGLPLAREGHLAHGGLLGRRLRLRGDAASGVVGGPQDLRRAARDHAGLHRVRDLLRPAPLRVARALQVLQTLRPRGHPDAVAELGAALPRLALRLPPKVPLHHGDRPVVRLRPERDDRTLP